MTIQPPPEPVAAEAVRAKAQEVVQAVHKALMKQFGALGPEIAGKLGPKLTADIPQRFEAFNYGLPESMDTMATSVANATVELNQMEVLNLEQVKQAVFEWQGNAADVFYEKFTMPFPQIAANHLSALHALHNAIKSSQGIIYAGRESVINIGDQTIAALNAITKKKKTSTLDKVLTVAGVIAAVVAVAVPVFGAAAVSAAALSASATAVRALAMRALVFSLASQATTLARVAAEQPVIEGGSVIKIVESMNRAIDKTWDEVHAESRHLEGAVSADTALLEPASMLPHAATILVDAANARDLKSFAKPPEDN